jgi:hypothetical protein
MSRNTDYDGRVIPCMDCARYYLGMAYFPGIYCSKELVEDINSREQSYNNIPL